MTYGHERKKKVLFVKNVTFPFIEKDVEILKKHFDVGVVHFVLNIRNLKDTLLTPFKMIKGVLWSDITFSWFADIHAFWAVLLSKLFRKKSIVVVGGFEVAKVPEINYGLMLSPKSACRTKYVLENADKLLAVSEFNKKEILKYRNPEAVERVYNGVNSDKFKPDGEKENLAITIAAITRRNKVLLKGLDTFVKSAKFLSDVKFLVIGIQGDALKKLQDIAPSNVAFIGPLSQDELISYYQKAKVYCQLSYRESFGMALTEAMSCECVPVVTNRAALPEVVDDTGFYVPYGDEKATAEAIKKALNSDKGKEARERIKKMFPIERREKELVEIIRGLIKEGK